MDRLTAMRAFVAVSDSGGFAPAAAKLALSPSVVTRLVARLENQLGIAQASVTAKKFLDHDPLSVQLGVIKVGKVSSAHLQITDDETISRLHAIIDADDEITIIDLGSTTGTFVNGAKVNKARLKLGDEIKIGGTTIRIVELTGR